MKPLSPNRPYLLRAYHDWLVDNELTPHLVVDAEAKGAQVPRQFVKDGQIVLNIADSAVVDLDLGNDTVEFNACFGGVAQQIVLPLASIIAIYARENGAGVVFELEDAYSTDKELVVEQAQSDGSDNEPQQKKKTSHLKVVK